MSRTRAAPTDVNIYEKMDPRDHIYQCPDMYIGAAVKIPMEAWVYDLNTKLIRKIATDLPEAIERLFLEIISNAGDNSKKSRLAGVDPGQIQVSMDRQTVCVRSSGLPIAVAIHPKYNEYGPAVIFGSLLSGSNFKGDRVGVGKNGLGAKLANVFSKQFMVRVGDADRKLEYLQIWQNNMREPSEPLITPYQGESYVEITYVLDFERFGYTEYPDDAFHLFARCALDTAMTCRVPVSFNGEPLNITMRDYVRLCFPDERQLIYHYEWPKEVTKVMVDEFGIESTTNQDLPIIELCIIDAPQHYDEEESSRRGEQISFVNGMMTRGGGVHVKNALNSITEGLLKTLNIQRKPTKAKAKKPVQETKSIKLTSRDVKSHLSIVLSCWVLNPTYNSQSKTQLTSPNLMVDVPVSLLAPVRDWNLSNRLTAALEFKYMDKMGTKVGRNKKYVDIAKLKDAQLAADKIHGRECALCLTEGDSGLAYPTKMISMIPDGIKYFGTYPMRGKPLNFVKADSDQIIHNEEYKILKEALGLTEGMDYSIDDNYHTLRYGRVILMPDADDDGKHIAGLIFTLFFVRFPTLLERGFVYLMRTPIIRVQKAGHKHKFFSEAQYQAWKTRVGDVSTWTHGYFKGLGSCTDEQIAEDSKAPRIVPCEFDSETSNQFSLVFNPKQSDQRKVWIETWRRVMDVEELTHLPISYFLQHEVILYSITNLHRSIPRLMDGLKISQRKIIWTVLKKYGYKRLGQEKYKVAQLSGKIASHTHYRYGEKSLNEAIINQTQNFVGACNLPYFSPEGQFGTRYYGGEDASDPRYIYVKLAWWLPLVFRKEDLPLLTMLQEDGHTIEPVSLLPILPLCLVNGSCGVGTGHSSLIPNHDPLIICQWLKAKIMGWMLPQIKPWYRGFTGVIEIVPRGTKVLAKEDEVEAVDYDENDEVVEPVREMVEVEEEGVEGTGGEERPVKSDHMTMITQGRFRQEGAKVIIDELPIGKWTHDYNKWLEKQVMNKTITSKVDNSLYNTVSFEVRGNKYPTVGNLRLQRSYGMSNMVLLSIDNSPVRYKTASSILETFYEIRLPFYEARKQEILRSIKVEIQKVEHKLQIIDAVLNRKLELYVESAGRRVARAKSDVAKDMQALGLPSEYLSHMRFDSVTLDGIADLNKELAALKKQWDEVNAITAAQLWVNDLDEFVVAYCKHYKCAKPKDVVPPKPVGRARAAH